MYFLDERPGCADMDLSPRCADSMCILNKRLDCTSSMYVLNVHLECTSFICVSMSVLHLCPRCVSSICASSIYVLDVFPKFTSSAVCPYSVRRMTIVFILNMLSLCASSMWNLGVRPRCGSLMCALDMRSRCAS